MFHKEKSILSLRLFSALLLFILLLSACSAPAVTPTATKTATVDAPPVPTVTLAAPTATVEPTQVQEDQAGERDSLSVDVNGVAQDVSSQVVPAVSASAGGPFWDVMPQYTLLTLAGYPITNHLLQPQIFVYPVNDLVAANAGAGQIVANLEGLLQSQEAGKTLPFLPLFNASQVIHAQVKYLDFKSGQGVRYLTQFDQGILPINNHELIYTYQGLTSDGKYYVAAVLPVNLAGLPADEKVNGQEPPEFRSDFPKYLEDTVSALEQPPAGAFVPDLNKLDAMVQSIEIQ